MLSEHFPVWLVPVISPIVSAFGDRIPPALKPFVLGCFAAGACALAVAFTPLELSEFYPQLILLYGLLTGGYTAARVADGTPAASPLGALSLASGIVGAIATPALAQTAPVAAAGGAPAASSVVVTLLSYGYGWLARWLTKKLSR